MKWIGLATLGVLVGVGALDEDPLSLAGMLALVCAPAVISAWASERVARIEAEGAERVASIEAETAESISSREAWTSVRIARMGHEE